MAARKNKGTKDAPWDETVREKIQSSMLINALQNHALGRANMTNTQIKAADILLSKTVPSLSSIEMSANLTERHVVSAEPLSEDEWASRYSDGLGSTAGAAESTH